MKNRTVTLLLACFTFGAVAQNSNPNTTLDNTILEVMQVEKLPGTSTVIVKDGKVVWMESYGLADVENNVPVTDSTVFLLASVSKVFTGTALHQILDRENISLDAAINTYLPFTISIPGHEATDLTFRHLMTHTSSIKDGDAMDAYYSNGDPSITLADCIQRYLTTTGADYNTTNFHPNAPGTVYDYSNMGTALAGYMVEVIAGIAFDTYCNNELFDPLCMPNTSWKLNAYDTNQVARPHQFTNGQYQAYNHYGFADYPNGLLRSNIKDMSRFLAAVLNQGTLNSTSILSPTSMDAMFTVQNPSLDATQGLNWYKEELFVNGNPVEVWGHNGGEDGVSTDIYIDHANNIAVGVFSNGEGDCLEICDGLMEYGLGLSVGNDIQPCIAGTSETFFNAPSKAFPNPSESKVTIAFPESINTVNNIEITSITGEVQQTILVDNTSEIVLDRADFIPGMYLYHLKTNSGVLVSKGKFIFF